MKKQFNTIYVIILGAILSIAIFYTGVFAESQNEPRMIYRIYVDGQPIGAIENKQALENYINEKEKGIKKQYNIDKVYAPVGLEIVNELTYTGKLSKPQEIYDKIQELKPFTIEGYEIKISGETDVLIYVLDKDVFTEAAEKTIKAFIGEKEYNDFINDTQREIIDFGKIIEDIYIEEDITIKETKIPIDKHIFTSQEELSKYLLFGTTEKQKEYEVKTGDTIKTVAYNNNLSVEEFLVANPQFTDVNNLLYNGQIVNIGLIAPKMSIVSEEHVVEEKIKEYTTEVRIDPSILAGNSYELRAGVDGREKVTQKIKKINGEIINLVPMASEEIEPAISRIYVKGGRVLANVADMGLWRWPTNPSYTITSPYGPRRGSFHGAIDISGTGYGSPIYAANNGTIHKISYNNTGGNYIIINHNNNYYTYYGHLASVRVKVGQVVQRGDVIATMGNTGYLPWYPYTRVGTHLHFAVYIGEPYRGGYHIDPLTLYRR